jgi:hypothetical protein
MARRIRGLTCGALITALALNGCASWHVEQVSPQALLDRDHPSEIQVQEKGGAQYVLESPKVVGDTLTGTVRHETPRETVEHLPRRIPLAAVAQVSTRKAEAGGTVAIVVLALGVAILAMFKAAYGNCQSSC